MDLSRKAQKAQGQRAIVLGNLMFLTGVSLGDKDLPDRLKAYVVADVDEEGYPCLVQKTKVLMSFGTLIGKPLPLDEEGRLFLEEPDDFFLPDSGHINLAGMYLELCGGELSKELFPDEE